MRKFMLAVWVAVGGFCPVLVNGADCLIRTAAEQEAMLMEDLTALGLYRREQSEAIEFLTRQVERLKNLARSERQEKHAAREDFEHEREALIRARNEQFDALLCVKQHFVRIEGDLTMKCEGLKAQVADLTKKLEEVRLGLGKALFDGSGFLP